MSYWQKQSDEPLFPDLLWSRPENKRGAGKLLIIGGQAGEFAHVASSFAAAEKAGAGYIKILLPDSLRKLAQSIPDVEFAPSNSSGGFAKNALGDFFELSAWADHTLLAGDFGKNSQTTTILDGFLLKNTKTTISNYALPSIAIPMDQLARLQVNLVLDFKNLQKLGTLIGLKTAITSTTPMDVLANLIHEISLGNKASISSVIESHGWTAFEGRVSSTPIKTVDQAQLAASVAVWTMQNPTKTFEAISTAIHEI